MTVMTIDSRLEPSPPRCLGELFHFVFLYLHLESIDDGWQVDPPHHIDDDQQAVPLQ